MHGFTIEVEAIGSEYPLVALGGRKREIRERAMSYGLA